MIAAALSAFAQATQREFLQDRQQTVGASSVGRCARQVFYEKNEGDPVYGSNRDPEYVNRWGATLRGSMIENNFWEPALRAAFGEKLLFAGQNQKTLINGFLSATPDGLAIQQPDDVLAHLGVASIEGDCVVLEAKSIDPRAGMDEPKAEHAFQIIVQIGLIREMTPYRPVWGLLSYVDASFWDVVHEFPIRYDPEIFDEAKRRARDIMLARSAQDLKPEGAIAGGKDCSLCAFTQACGQAAAARVPVNNKPVVAEMADAIAALARDAKILRGAAAQTLLDAKQREEEVRAMLVAAETRKLAHDGVHVSWTPLKSGEGDRLTIKILAPATAVEPSDVPPASPADVTEAA
jgi:hypothetical protein